MKIKDLDYQTFLYYSDNNYNEIPQEKGIYYWVYYPDIDPKLSGDKFVEDLKKYSEVSLSLPEYFSDQKFHGMINEIWFDHTDENSVFGLSRKRSAQLIEYLNLSEHNRKNFVDFFKNLCFSRPFYVGMTENLKTRLSSHLAGTGSDILTNIESLNIKKNNIWISYSIFPEEFDSKLIKIHEEIYQRFVKPGLTKKFG
ncbi:hypothetical protein ACFS5J_04070 [Flavobacterium chuncheonense]|uniref:GIY-YIG domain-containing protein n=1 Tax=Flavobacterium chuncheonense TaxID=2026653 RepID=A0ABW5YJD6_9FLAO